MTIATRNFTDQQKKVTINLSGNIAALNCVHDSLALYRGQHEMVARFVEPEKRRDR